MCPCPHFSGQIDLVAAATQSVLAAVHLHTSRAMHTLWCSGGYNPSLLVFRASTEAHGFCLLVPTNNKKLIMQAGSVFSFLLQHGGGTCHGLALSQWLFVVSARAGCKLEQK